ncbi:MAG: hypothetical protein RL481_386, partial [Pseudomonadota bacterium]
MLRHSGQSQPTAFLGLPLLLLLELCDSIGINN